MPERDRRLSIKISEQEWEMLHEIAESLGLTASDVVRQWIRGEYSKTQPKGRRKGSDR